MKVSNQRILIISDPHYPFQHPDTLSFLQALKTKYKPTRIICVGDEADKHALSYHESDPDLPSAGQELLYTQRALKDLYKLFPRVDVLESNHGSLAYRKAKTYGIPKSYLRDPGEVLDAPSGWQWHTELILKLPTKQELLIVHGLSKDVMRVVAQRGMCVIQGHYHTELMAAYLGTHDHLLWGMTVGCLINPKLPAFAYAKHNIKRQVIGTGLVINGLPILAPMLLNAKGRWTGVIP